ncbi:MAG: hypothetical protein HY735_35600 [Verrucomicrobia bacterium]|nr:hypothetical protein [Verrucomicrobiota bacterium]
MNSSATTRRTLRDYPIRRVARVTIEFTTAFHAGSGRAGEDVDALVVTDANGLPAIPGSSLAGALATAFAARIGESSDNERKHGQTRTGGLFGWQQKAKGQGSRLHVSWGCLHNARGFPVEGILTEAELVGDPVLSLARRVTARDHVALGHRGATEGGRRLKFDEQPCAAGHRFTFELELTDTEPGRSDWEAVLRCFGQADVRLGGRTRRGYGGFRVVAMQQRSYDLRLNQGFDEFAARPIGLGAALPGARPFVTPASGERLEVWVTLNPLGWWLFGAGVGEADMEPVCGDRIEWASDDANAPVKAVRTGLVLVPGSAVKGALSHRIAFHHNRLDGCWANRIAPDDRPGNDARWLRAQADKKLEAFTGQNNKAVRCLFGQGKTGSLGQRGRVLLNDALLVDPGGAFLPHVAIDRFTGGTLGGALFSESPRWRGGPFELKFTVLQPEQLPSLARQALHAALTDLVEARLPIGGGAMRGRGFCRGELVWQHFGPGGATELTGDRLEQWLKQSPPKPR